MRLNGGAIVGGIVQQSGTNGLRFSSNSNNTLNATTVRGTLTVGDAANPSGVARFINGVSVLNEAGSGPGVVNVGTVAGATNAFLSFNGSQSFNDATINLGNATQNGFVSLEGGATLTLGSGAIVQGSGNFGPVQFVGGTNNIVNAGTFSANINGRTLTVNPNGTFSKSGLLEARNGGTLTVQPGGSFTNFSGTTLTGGTYNAVGASTLRLAGITSQVTNAANIMLDGIGSQLLNASSANLLASFATNAAAGSFTIINGRSFTTASSFSNAGVVNVGPSSTFTGGGAFTNQPTGQLQMAGGNFAGPSLANAGIVSGFGVVAPVVSNSGTVRASGGSLTLSGGVLGATGTVLVDTAATLELGATSSARDLTHNGTLLGLGANNIAVFNDYNNANFGVGNSYNRRAGVTGAGQILASGTTQQTLSGALVTGGNTGSATMTLPNIRVGLGGTSTTFTINNTGLGGPSLRGALVTTGISNLGLTGSGVTAQNWGAVSQTGPGQTFTVTFDPAFGQALTGQVLQVVNNFDNVAGQSLSFAGQAFNLAAASAAAPNPVVFANQRVGGTLS